MHIGGFLKVTAKNYICCPALQSLQ